ncbi:hypothetical protein H7J86_05485 [Mycobacterium hackensackense]|uniref:hypothetical protein n=1 Tax=Mycobacterium hackensackense TaxID=228909 RepID=UPI0022658205|nr:hypothetical protein [Mycobacterium hackensackense]MCV7251608.1 hypothetical protein [Mycobacterium hackensackense]
MSSIQSPWLVLRDDRFNLRVQNRSSTDRYYVKVGGPQVTRLWEWDVFAAGAVKLIRVMPGDDKGPEVNFEWSDDLDPNAERHRLQEFPNPVR